MLKAIIIDDEEASVRTLELLLNAYCPSITLVGKGQSVRDGVELISKNNPDIVFLDIEMPEASGFELLEQIPNPNFEVIFITAYNQYAIKAFKYSAIDYILKPIDIDELVKAVEKVTELRKAKVNPRERYKTLFQNIEQALPSKLVIPRDKDFTYIDLTEVIMHTKTDNGYCFTMVDGTKTECPEYSFDIKTTLESKDFVEFEKDKFLNLHMVKTLDKKGAGCLIMEGDISIPLNNTNKDRIVEQLEKISLSKGNI
ncbi:MAG: response regulator transcription factor [Bacteroidales bacterium]|nr:response regulator transcription factor [Tenuifilaceae bacterium]